MSLNKAAMMTDAHWGKHSNSELHNQDCMNFIKFFINEVQKDKEIDHIVFLGDWHEHRSAINGMTLNYSYEGAKLLNSLDLPIYWLVGNHDLYYRNSRGIFTTGPFDSLSNINLINEPTVIKEIGNKTLFSPYLFPHEFSVLDKFKDIPVWNMHADAKGFVLTGETKTSDHGLDHTMF